jgi:hypothetical protein
MMFFKFQNFMVNFNDFLPTNPIKPLKFLALFICSPSHHDLILSGMQLTDSVHCGLWWSWGLTAAGRLRAASAVIDDFEFYV